MFCVDDSSMGQRREALGVEEGGVGYGRPAGCEGGSSAGLRSMRSSDPTARLSTRRGSMRGDSASQRCLKTAHPTGVLRPGARA